MKTRLLNFVIGAIMITEDDEGNIVEKAQIEPVEVFNEEQAKEVFVKVRESIDQKNNGE